jgi:flagellar secretion chaperone FliS
MNASTALEAYKAIKTQAAVIDEASPHQLVTLLFDGALERIAEAKGAIERIEQAGDGLVADQVAAKGEAIGKAIAILDSLRVTLDHEQGGELAGNLSGLYDYMTRRLLEANATKDVAMLAEVAGLVKEIKIAWSQVPPELHRVSE